MRTLEKHNDHGLTLLSDVLQQRHPQPTPPPPPAPPLATASSERGVPVEAAPSAAGSPQAEVVDVYAADDLFATVH